MREWLGCTCRSLPVFGGWGMTSIILKQPQRGRSIRCARREFAIQTMRYRIFRESQRVLASPIGGPIGEVFLTKNGWASARLRQKSYWRAPTLFLMLPERLGSKKKD